MKKLVVIRPRYSDLGLMKQAIRMSKDSCCGGRAAIQ